MIISAKNLIGLRVETKSGQKLGRARDFEIDADALEIKKFYVRPSGIVKGFSAGDLIVGKNSVISIDEQKMVVEDLAAGELAKERIGQRVAVKSLPVAASSREE